MSTQMYEVVFEATGEVRDADGNLVSSEPFEAKALLTEAQVQAFVDGQVQE